MMLCLVKRVRDCDRALRAGTLKNRNDYTGDEAFGRTVGIIGLGNVGRRVAELAGILFKMQVLAYDPYLSADVVKARGAEKVELDELLQRADFVSINCPLTRETRKIIGAREFALMKPQAYFITTARGSFTTRRRSNGRCATRKSPAPALTCGKRNRRRPVIR